MNLQVVATRRTGLDAIVTFETAPERSAPGAFRFPPGDLRVREVSTPTSDTPRITLIVSLGTAGDGNPESVRRAGGAVGQWIYQHHLTRVGVDPEGLDALGLPEAIPVWCEGLLLGVFRFDRHKSKRDPHGAPTVYLLAGKRAAALKPAVTEVSTTAESVNLAREWGHEPPNVLNPVTLASRLARLAAKLRLTCRVYDEKHLARMKAGGILAVGAASRTPPRLIVLEYGGGVGKRARRPIVLVGKAITFDTGGYSLKDKHGIVGMKYDKCGGMAVIGAMKAAAALRLKIPLIGVIAAAENMISGKAYRPNDILTTMSGKTVEIISTDAEGRIVLADALTFAQREYQPRMLIDLATLTGGVEVALGSVRAGLFANDDRLAEDLCAAGDRVHERLWRLPLDEEYLEPMHGDDSDLKNSAGRSAHPILGAIFLKQFVENKIPWAHIDVAGTAHCEKDQPYCPKGATGFGVRLLVDYLRRQ